MPPSACFKTAVICSTEKRFLFTPQLLGLVGRIVPHTHIGCGPKNPEPLTLSPAQMQAMSELALEGRFELAFYGDGEE